MKKNLFRILLILALCTALCAAILSVSAAAPAEGAVYSVDKPYEYPILPGTDEWMALDGLEEKIQACHVDEELLASMTTPALLDTVLDYPLLCNIFAFNTLKQGIDSVSQYFKGIEILAAREDAVLCLQARCEAQAQSGESDIASIAAKNLCGYLEAVSAPSSIDGSVELQSEKTSDVWR